MSDEAPQDACAQRLRLAVDLFGTGEQVMRENLRRRHPHADPSEIDDLLRAWLEHRPGAEAGDAVGRSRSV